MSDLSDAKISEADRRFVILTGLAVYLICMFWIVVLGL